MTSKIHRVRGERGMSLVEALVSLALLSLVMVAFLGVLDSTSRMAKVQGNIADSTENLRFSMAALVRVVRMTGTGGLPLISQGASGFQRMAIDIQNNFEGTFEHTLEGLSDLGGKTPIHGTDVLTIRGVISSDLYEIRGGAIDFSASPGIITIPNMSPWGAGGEQSLNYIPANCKNMPLVITTNESLDIESDINSKKMGRSYSGFRVVNVADEDPPVSDPTTPDPQGVSTVDVKFVTNGDSVGLNPNGAFTEPIDEIVWAVGFLEEMTLFIAENASGEPALYRFTGGADTAEELVPNIVNFQVALGCDLNVDGAIIGPEWFYSADNPSTDPTFDNLNTLEEIRLSLVARSDDPDPRWTDPTIMPENADPLDEDEQRYRYRVMTVRTGLRCHPDLEELS